MRWLVKGAWKENGQDGHLFIDALHQQVAELIAANRGLLVESSVASPRKPRAATKRRRRNRPLVPEDPAEVLQLLSEVARPSDIDPNVAWREAVEMAGVPEAPPVASAPPPKPAGPNIFQADGPAVRVRLQVTSDPARPQTPTQSPDEIRLELDRMIGMSEVKDELLKIEALLKVNKRRIALGMTAQRPAMHYVFRGRPGTGKTTVARVLGRLFHSYGILPIGHVIETDRAGLVAEYLGQTAIKVDAVFQQALGGVLFIDEAYTLARLGMGYVDGFGLEAIDALMKRMEDHRDRIVVIVAGYPEEMDAFLQANPGMLSRFTRYIDFADYDPDELTAIFQLMARDAGYHIEIAALIRIELAAASMYERRDRTFGNARAMRNLLEASIGLHALRVSNLSTPTVQDLSTLMSDDIAALA